MITIKYMSDIVTEDALMKQHNLTWIEAYKLKSNNIGGSFILDGLEYFVGKAKKNHKTRSLYTISKGKEKYTELVPKEVEWHIKRFGSVISSKTIKTGSAMINGWFVERENFVPPE